MFHPTPIELLIEPPQLSDIDFDSPEQDSDDLESKDVYKGKLKALQRQMLDVQQAYYHQKRRAIIVFEGWDAAGKGGCIRRLTERLDPRGYKVHAIGAPGSDEQGKHYLYRFQCRLPSPGDICIFDRSYYGRVLVERVEGFASEQQWQRAYREINEFERLLVDDGARIVKIFLHINKEEQVRRFKQRLEDPIKRWKLTEEDIRNHRRWSEYEDAINDMFAQTSSNISAWNLIPSKRKWGARLKVLESVISALSHEVDISPPPIDKSVIKAVEKHFDFKLSE